MPYDIATPYGTSQIGLLSPDEAMSRQHAAQRALAMQAEAAQKAVADKAGPPAGAGGYGGAGPSGFADDAPSLETQRMQGRNDMVDLRQQSTRAAQDRTNMESGIPEAGSRADIGDWRGLQEAQIGGGLAKEKQQQAIRERFQALMGGGAAPGAAAAPSQQNALVGGANPPKPDENAMEDRLLELSILGQQMNGGQAPDVTGAFNKRADRKTNADRNAIELKALEAQLAETQRQSQVGRVAQDKAAGGDAMNPKATYATAVPALQGELQRVGKFIRDNNWSIAGNKPQLHALYNQVLERARQIDASPQAMALIEQDLKNVMRDALQENGLIFKSAGTEGVEQDFGL